jgi:hypothetical protein
MSANLSSASSNDNSRASVVVENAKFRTAGGERRGGSLTRTKHGNTRKGNSGSSNSGGGSNSKFQRSRSEGHKSRNNNVRNISPALTIRNKSIINSNSQKHSTVKNSNGARTMKIINVSKTEKLPRLAIKDDHTSDKVRLTALNVGNKGTRNRGSSTETGEQRESSGGGNSRRTVNNNASNGGGGGNIYWISVPAEKNDFLSARPSWSTVAAAMELNSGGGGLPSLAAVTTSAAQQQPVITTSAAATSPIVDADVINLSTNPAAAATLVIKTRLLGNETIEYNDASSRIKYIRVKEMAAAAETNATAGASAVDGGSSSPNNSLSPSASSTAAAAFSSGGDSGRRSPFGPFLIASARRAFFKGASATEPRTKPAVKEAAAAATAAVEVKKVGSRHSQTTLAAVERDTVNITTSFTGRDETLVLTKCLTKPC